MMMPDHRPYGAFRRLAVVAAITLAFAGAGEAQEQSFTGKHRDKVVFIEAFPNTDQLNSERRIAGSGVLLARGYVLTARHFAKAGALFGEGRLRFYGRRGSAEADRRRRYYIGDLPRHDLLVLTFNQEAVEGDPFACIRPPSPPARIDDEIRIIGFPNAATVIADDIEKEHILTSRQGEITGIGAVQIYTSIDTTFGDSGAPVLDLDGRVVGIVKGEATINGQGIGATSIIPIERAEPILPRIVREATCDMNDVTLRGHTEGVVRVGHRVKGRGHLNAPPPDEETGREEANNVLSLELTGGEFNECSDARELTRSEGMVEAIVQIPPDQNNTIGFSATVEAKGGFYLNAVFGCTGPIHNGKQGNDNQTTAKVEIFGEFEADMRATQPIFLQCNDCRPVLLRRLSARTGPTSLVPLWKATIR